MYDILRTIEFVCHNISKNEIVSMNLKLNEIVSANMRDSVKLCG